MSEEKNRSIEDKNENLDKKSGGDRRVKNVFFENLELLKIEDLSFLIQVPEKTIRDWIYKRQIPYVKIGKHVRFALSEISEWIERSKYGD